MTKPTDLFILERCPSKNRPNLSVGRELSALHLGLRLNQVRFFVGRRCKNRLFVASKSEPDPHGPILVFWRKGLQLLNGLFEQCVRVENNSHYPEETEAESPA